MRVLVTGGAGYIGSHCVLDLMDHGHEVAVLDDLCTGHRDFVRAPAFYEVTLLDRPGVEAALDDFAPEAVVHFAARAQVAESVRDPFLYYGNNTAGSLNLIQACAARGVGRFIFSSTCATYGVPESMPIRETTPQNPVNPYGRSKLVVEWMLRDAARQNLLNSVAFRYFNVAGADPDARTGERHDPETHVIPCLLSTLHAGQGPEFSLFGDDYPTPDGTCVRDYVHVSDLVAAHRLGLDWLGGHPGHQVFNLGSEKGFSVRDVMQVTEKVTGKTVPYSVKERRPGDPPTLVADANRAKHELGWAPRFSRLEDMVATAWAWHQKDWSRT